MRLLIVESDSLMAQGLELQLKSEGFNVYTTDLGEEGVDLARIYDYDALVVDYDGADMPGMEVVRHLRQSKITVPILILCRSGDVDTLVKVLNEGADYYLGAPFHKTELVAALYSLIRRSRGHARSIVTTGQLEVDLEAKTVNAAGRRLHLTGKEYAMLELLSLRRGQTLSKENFLNHLYGGMDEPELKIIDVFICKLRKKLTNASEGRNYIETVWGRGYVAREPYDAGERNIA